MGTCKYICEADSHEIVRTCNIDSDLGPDDGQDIDVGPGSE